jgi:hypothetical protein
VAVHAHLRLEPVEKQHLPAKPAEAQEVLEENPGVAADAGPLRQ